MIKHLPNTITLVNLFAGCMAIIYCLEGQYLWVLLLMVISLLADYTDGLVARAFNVKSELGAQLDSLADAVTFGVLPGIIYYVLIENAIGDALFQGIGTTANYYQPLLRLEHLGFLFPVFAVVRLGKFNIDTRQTDNFIGLATPGATLFVAGLLMIFHFEKPYFYNLVTNFYFLTGSLVGLCALMVSEFPMFSFKIKEPGWEGNEMRIIFLLLCVPAIAFLKWSCLPVLILLYVFCSGIEAFVIKRSDPDSKDVDQEKESKKQQ